MNVFLGLIIEHLYVRYAASIFGIMQKNRDIDKDPNPMTAVDVGN